MSQFTFKVEHLPKPVEFQASITDMFAWLSPLCLQKQYLWDNNYWYISLIDWGKVLKDVCFNMPKYSADKFDCEDFAMLVSSRVSERYQINTCGIAIGTSPIGEHGFNLLVTETGLIYFEPQTGEFIPVDDGSYRAHTVIFGG